jgi:hypothetical protein
MAKYHIRLLFATPMPLCRDLRTSCCPFSDLRTLWFVTQTGARNHTIRRSNHGAA